MPPPRPRPHPPPRSCRLSSLPSPPSCSVVPEVDGRGCIPVHRRARLHGFGVSLPRPCFRRSNSTSEKSYQLEILQESVLRTLHDIENEFFEEAYENGSPSGTTASVVLITDGQIFVANIGDSKSFLCSQEHAEGVSHDNANSFYAKELTVDHHPDREDERARVEAAGGYVSVRSGIAFINGGFPLSRAIGDLPMRGLGVIPVPEVTDWQPLSKEDSYIVVASDGIFERMTTNDVCNLLQDVPMDVDDTSLSKYIVNAAYKGGSSDNLSAIVIPLTSSSRKPGSKVRGKFRVVEKEMQPLT